MRSPQSTSAPPCPSAVAGRPEIGAQRLGGAEACDRCLQRAWLVGSLSARIEGALGAAPAGRSLGLLGLDDAKLASAVAGGQAHDFVERSRRRDGVRLRAAVRGAHAWACCRHADSYPSGLRDLSDPPAVVFGRGDPRLLAALEPEASAVTVVGSRKPSAYGREMAVRLGREIAASGITVVSGMALGIDSCSHEGALEGEGATVAVLGSGPDVPHPAGSRALYERIADRGLILSELPPGTQPRRWTFPARNRMMAALGSMSVVVEARGRSGSLITASIATELGRDVGAVPGRVGNASATGANSLLRDGAHVIRSGQDVLDSLLGPGAGGAAVAPGSPSLEPELVRVLEAVEEGAATQDAISRSTEQAPGAAATALVRLELLGLITSDSGGRYRRTTLETASAA